MKSQIEPSNSRLISDSCSYIISGLTEGIDMPDRPARQTLNKLNLIEFCLKNGSLKFKTGMENMIDFSMLKNYTSEDNEELILPIRNIATRVSDLMEKPEELKKAREEAQKLRERIKGVNNEFSTRSLNEDSKYGGFSSDNVGGSNYDQTYNVNLTKKLGIAEEPSPNYAQKPITKPTAEPTLSSIVKKPAQAPEPTPKPNSNDIDLLDIDTPKTTKTATDAASQDKNLVDLIGDDKQGGAKPKKLLPAPPKKGALPPPPKSTPHSTFASTTGTSTSQTTGNDLNAILDLDVGKPAAASKTQAPIDLDLLGLSGSTAKPTPNQSVKKSDDNFEISFDAKPIAKPKETTTPNPVSPDLFDLSDLKNAKIGTGPKVDDYVQFLAKTQTKLPPPPTATPKDKYDFLNS